jgi:hypothetical protein
MHLPHHSRDNDGFCLDSTSANTTRYERVAIEAWVNQFGSNPVTRETLSNINLIHDEALQSEIDNFVTSVLRPASLRDVMR